MHEGFCRWNTYSFQIITRGWMKELFTHVIIESLPHFDQLIDLFPIKIKNLRFLIKSVAALYSKRFAYSK